MTRVFTVGVPAVVYLPADERQLVTLTAARIRLIEFYREHPRRVATVVRRVCVPEQRVHVFSPHGLFVTHHARDQKHKRLAYRLRDLERDCGALGLLLGTESWIAHVETPALERSEAQSTAGRSKRRNGDPRGNA